MTNQEMVEDLRRREANALMMVEKMCELMAKLIDYAHSGQSISLNVSETTTTKPADKPLN